MELYFIFYGSYKQPIANPFRFLDFENYQKEELDGELLENIHLQCKFKIVNGLVKNIWFNEKDGVWSRNMKKRVISLFNIQNISKKHFTDYNIYDMAFTASEDSFDGDKCATDYEVEQSVGNTFNFSKFIDFNNCENTAYFDDLQGQTVNECQQRTAELNYELIGSHKHYEFKRVYYKSNCFSDNRNKTVIMKMLWFHTSKKIFKDVNVNVDSETLLSNYHDNSQQFGRRHSTTIFPALDVVKKIGGINLEVDYPWLNKNGRCRTDVPNPPITGREYKVRKEENVSNERLMELVEKHGPVAVSIWASLEMREYKGKKKYTNCKAQEFNHVLTLVGYDTDKEGTYWILKNSWGVHHGDDGYFYIMMNKFQFDCGITREVVYVV
uniref:Peptidase C1A papain C-terminal domain-containing protein n=1 Tax=Panagrolaimus sp. ES5 TaxID=591445 RepID=A0AC34FSP0_9BILA